MKLRKVKVRVLRRFFSGKNLAKKIEIFLKILIEIMAYQGPQKVQKVMVQPINLIFRFLQNRTRVSVWLYENVNTRIEGKKVTCDYVKTL